MLGNQLLSEARHDLEFSAEDREDVEGRVVVRYDPCPDRTRGGKYELRTTVISGQNSVTRRFALDEQVFSRTPVDAVAFLGASGAMRNVGAFSTGANSSAPTRLRSSLADQRWLGQYNRP
ncbi:hypothetical protein KM043_001427 [Ampulex compressa]|nr:hypothetical protein KM043_001427 [Ampulex compressa]